MRIYALVFFNPDNLEPIKHTTYIESKNSLESKFISEFVDFGRKELIRQLKSGIDVTYIISLADNRFLIYITYSQHQNIGLAFLVSHMTEVDDTLHILSDKLINNFILNYLP